VFTDVVSVVTLDCTVLILVTAVATLLCTESTLALIVLTDVVRVVTFDCTEFTFEAKATVDPPTDSVLAVASKIKPPLLEVILPLAIMPFLTLKSF
jgi:hypothetical protein